MFTSSAAMRVYLALGHTDMRKSINGLSILVESHLDLDPFSGHLFVFCNKKCHILKILYWDKNGFCLWQKRLEKLTEEEHRQMYLFNEAEEVFDLPSAEQKPERDHN